MIGKRFSHYLIEAELGAGGMGVVYRALDEHLGRAVALKLLSAGSLADESSRTRFRREAQALSRLSHPGVAMVFDFDTQDDTDFLVMEYVPGGSLAARLEGGALPLEQVTTLGIRLAEALYSAHAQGIVHRDFKPGNVVLAADDSPKILDFGLARLVAEAANTQDVTRPGMVVGTLAYMSPEQVRGQVVDARSDIWSLGVVLYEMATGSRPFANDAPESLLYNIVHTTPPRPVARRADIPGALERVIMRCLEKDAARRYPSAADAARDLRDADSSRTRTLPAGAPVIRSLAVLPFENLSRDAAQDYFADGMTEALIFDLSRIKALRVISRTSAMQYRGVRKPLPEIARELNVDGVVEGSVLLLGNRVRITAQLIDARSDENMWAERYERDLEDVLALQSEVAQAVAKEIRVQLSPGEATRLAERPTVDARAHDQYLKGRFHWAKRGPAAIDAAQGHFEAALAADPSFALAWLGVADCQLTRGERGMAPLREAMNAGLEAVDRALAIDDQLAEAHLVRAIITFRLEWNWDEGLARAERAIELEPGSARAHNWRGRLLFCLGRHPEAQRELHRVIELDPLSMINHTSIGDAYFYARDYERSIEYYKKALELDPSFDGAHTDLARSYELLGRHAEALAEYEAGARMSRKIAGPSFGMAHLHASAGRADQARAMLEQLIADRKERVVSAWGIGVLHASLGDVDEAFRWLDLAVEESANGLTYARVHPRLDPLRKDPRYPELLRRIGHRDI